MRVKESNSGRKVEPVSHGVTPEQVAEIGLTREQGAMRSEHETRGYKAPGIASTTLPRGTQGRNE